jgi:hypothetical protein
MRHRVNVYGAKDTPPSLFVLVNDNPDSIEAPSRSSISARGILNKRIIGG